MASPRFSSKLTASNINFEDESVEAEETDVSSVQESTQDDIRTLGRRASPVLSDPDHTEFIDLDVPPPEAGWDEEGIPTSETQILLNGTTQIPDLSLPELDSGWNDDMPSSPPELPSSPPDHLPPSDLPPDELNARLDAWIDEHVAAGRSSSDVITALECTSLDHHLADQVLEHMSTHQGRIPQRTRGVWTDADEKDRTSTDARRIRRVEEKHGADIFALRWDFMDAYR